MKKVTLIPCCGYQLQSDDFSVFKEIIYRQLVKFLQQVKAINGEQTLSGNTASVLKSENSVYCNPCTSLYMTEV